MKFYRNSEVGLVIGVDEAGVHEFKEIIAVETVGNEKPTEIAQAARKNQSAAKDNSDEAILARVEKGEKKSAIAKDLGIPVQKVYNLVYSQKKKVLPQLKKKEKPFRLDDLDDEEADDDIKVRTFKCQDAIDCGIEFKKNTSAHTASCPKCGMSAFESK